MAGKTLRTSFPPIKASWAADETRDCERRAGFAPMLARTFGGARLLRFPVYVQPKLNGWRCLASSSGLYTRGGYRITSMPHIETALAPVFRVHPDLVLDGELYCHGLPLNKIASAVKRRRPNADSGAIRYHVFDLISDDDFDQRIATVDNILGGLYSPDAVRCVKTLMISNIHLLHAHYRNCLGERYEGQMIREAIGGYESGRSYSLLKRKPGEGDWSETSRDEMAFAFAERVAGSDSAVFPTDEEALSGAVYRALVLALVRRTQSGMPDRPTAFRPRLS